MTKTIIITIFFFSSCQGHTIKTNMAEIENILQKAVADSNSPAVQYILFNKDSIITNLILGFFIDKSKYMEKPEGKWKPFNNFYVNGASYGGLIGTPTAFVKYIQEIIKSNNRLLSDDFKKMLFTENHTTGDKPTGMGLSWFSGQLNGNKYFAHAGGGYYCEIRIYPDKGIGSVIFFNMTGMSDERFLDNVDKIYFDNHAKAIRDFVPPIE